MKNQNPDTNRRDFLKLGSAAVATTAVSWSATSYAAIVGANDRVRVGVVGCGDRMQRRRHPGLPGPSEGDELRARRRLRHLEPPPRRGRRLRREAVRQARSIPSSTTTSCTPARTSTRSSSPPPTSSTRSTASRPSRPAATPTSKSPPPTRMDDARAFLKAVEGSKQVIAVGTQRRSTPAYIKASEYIQSGKFGDIVMVEMTWNVNQPGRWRRPDVVPLLKEADTDWTRYLLGVHQGQRSTRASILSSGSSGRTPPAFPTSGSSTRSTPCTGSPACRIRALSSPTAASTCGRTAAPTGTP